MVFWEFVGWLATSVVTTAAQTLLAYPDAPAREEPDDFDLNRVPIARQGAPVPIVYGRTRIQPVNTLALQQQNPTYIPRKEPRGSFLGFDFGHRELGGVYEYRMSIGVGLCLGEVHALHRVWLDNIVVIDEFIALNRPMGFFANSDPVIKEVSKRNVFGGEDNNGRGGVEGEMIIYAGTRNQRVEPALVDMVGADLATAFRHTCWILWKEKQGASKGFYWGRQSLLPGQSFEVSRYPNPLGLPNNGRITNDDNTEDANPANVIYDQLTNPVQGRKVDPEDIDVASFYYAGEVLNFERHGYSRHINRPEDTGRVINDVLRQIDGIMFQNDEGKVELRLIRYDYDISAAPHITEDDVVGTPEISRANSGDDTITQYKVSFPDRFLQYNTGVAIAQDDAAIDAGNNLRTEEQTFHGCSNLRLGNIIATRELNQRTTPLTEIKVPVLADSFPEGVRPGDIFIFSYKKDRIANAVMRVGNVEVGDTGDDGVVRIDAIQDQFFANYAIFNAGETDYPSGRLGVLLPLSVTQVQELPYFLSASNIAARTTGTGDPNDSYLFYIAQPNPNDLVARGIVTLVKRSGELSFSDDIEGVPNSGAHLRTALTETSDSLTLERFVGQRVTLPNNTESDIRSGRRLLFIGNEILSWRTVTSADDGGIILSGLERGLLDTVPQAHEASTQAWFSGTEEPVNFGSQAFRGTESLEVKILPTNAFGELDEETVDAVPFQLRQRAQRPLLPVPVSGFNENPPWFCRNVVRNPDAKPDDQVTDFICTRPTTGGYAYSYNGSDASANLVFLDRNRLSGRIALRDDPSVDPEPGTELISSWMDNRGPQTQPLDRIGNGVYRVNFGTFGAKTNITIRARRNGLDSFQTLNLGDVQFARTPGTNRTRISGDTHGGGP